MIEMPHEQVEWFMKQSVHENDKIRAQQCCTYYSFVNVNKKKYPYLNSYEREQTWTLTRTISKTHKRYQSSIDSIHLSMPTSSIGPKHIDYENVNLRNGRSTSTLPSKKYASSLSPLHSSSTNMNSAIHRGEKSLPVKVIIDNNSNSKSNSTIKTSRLVAKLTDTIHDSDEFAIRI